VKLPRTVYSCVGPVPVRVVPESDLPENASGLWSERHRTILLVDNTAPATQTQTLMHEIIHVAMTDSGMRHAMDPDQAEMWSDALGYYLAAAVYAGYIRLCEPRK
jgi:Zn-dependent peptidase ImmA (M78 family)